ncbi:23S rRNA pseudouridine2605 synthase [Brachybacterium muris]|uniref:Pseudouridine synthase n=1 Tax=Brachybacterium muris UCD-AY4 TaxID=1249481 RepID=A0A022L3E4_9MICO|nr:pseudouridine synthase [Brachybacterium muris]PZP16941.1 MAG: rRNA pseudouridine synthase [Brachybacterium faecium]EYT50530.1 MFS transporter [Brachybacterium muris UCD-AY4]MBM7500585.1 23S rRNA pseudouridine2605 synthase [Brachybacterium muris]MCT2176338.1 rRNA pseudouridine synthase [Brachybacterium muris]MCT2261634.1 rRNA pseudouridine synthase [Brachybacterium muris]
MADRSRSSSSTGSPAPKKRRRSAFTPPRTVRLRDDQGERVRSGGDTVQAEDGERLQKVLARAGFGSRRACEALISSGRVTVDGQVVVTQGVRVDPARQVVHVDGRRLQLDEGKTTVVLHKPRKVVSAMSDPEGRRDLSEFAGRYEQRLYHVGRLDYETEGLLLLTNDGELAHRLTHPSFEIAKTYVCRFDAPGGPPRSLVRTLREGVDLEDGPARADKARVLAQDGREAVVEVTLHEGRNRIVRRMFASQGFELTRLVRTRIGPVLLGELAPGEMREVTDKELGTLMAEVGL